MPLYSSRHLLQIHHVYILLKMISMQMKLQSAMMPVKLTVPILFRSSQPFLHARSCIWSFLHAPVFRYIVTYSKSGDAEKEQRVEVASLDQARSCVHHVVILISMSVRVHCQFATGALNWSSLIRSELVSVQTWNVRIAMHSHDVLLLILLP